MSSTSVQQSDRGTAALGALAVAGAIVPSRLERRALHAHGG